MNKPTTQTKNQKRQRRFAEVTGSAQFRCNICGDVVTRKLGWKLWTKSLCMKTGKMARLYRISAPIENPQTPTGVLVRPVVSSLCECANWVRGITPEKWYGRTRDGIPLVTNHHPNCPHYNDSLIDAWKVTVDGISAYMDNEQDAKDTAGDDGKAVIACEKMHKEIFEHLPEFEGY